MNECIFCKIIDGQVPCQKLLEDDDALAFLDIGPVAEGHALLIPKTHCETLAELTPEQSAGTCKHLPALVQAVGKAVDAAGVNILQNNGRVAGQLVPHVHFHIIPRQNDDRFGYNWPAGEYPPGRIEELAESIRQCL
jgi:histidine triad (HIT) family protein